MKNLFLNCLGPHWFVEPQREERLQTLLLEHNAFTLVREDMRILTFVMGEEVMSERGSGTVVTVARAQRGAELQHSCWVLRQRRGGRKKGVGRKTGEKEARNATMSKAGKGEGKASKGR